MVGMEVAGEGLGIGEMSDQSIMVLYGEIGKDFCPNLSPASS